MGRLLIGFGVLLVFAGLVVIGLEHFGLGPGRLPGDFVWRGRNVQFYFPLGTCILLSVVLSALVFLFSRMRH